MTDDIVTRLRKKYLGQLPICLEAADEIERLRKIINRWETCKMVYDNLCEPDELCEACQEVAGC